MNDIGYIKLYRQLAENPLWKEKPFTRGQAWVDLLMKANYKDVKAMIKGQIVTVKRGQLLRGEDNLAEDWGWSRSKVRRFLSKLEAERMCHVNGTYIGTLITIENYETFQSDRPQNDTTGDTADDTTGDTGVKKEKKEKKERGFFEAPTLADVSSYVKELGYQMDPAAYFDYYSETNWRKKNGQPIRDWKASVRTWERREKEFAKGKDKDLPKKPAQIEPPKYKQLEPDPEVETVQMPADMRKKLKKIEILEGAL